MENEIAELIRAVTYEKLAAGTAGAMEPIVQQAARAIAERMKEGVVWERRCRIAHLNRVMGMDIPGTELTDDAGDTIYALIVGQWLEAEVGWKFVAAFWTAHQQLFCVFEREVEVDETN